MTYGHRVTIERLRNGRKESFVFGCKGSMHHARANATMKGGFLSVTKIENLTEREYRRAFPDAHLRKARTFTLDNRTSKFRPRIISFSQLYA